MKAIAKERHRLFLILLTLAMAFSMTGMGTIAYAQVPHFHTDKCYEVEETLVCNQEQTAGHAHDNGCLCPGGENACGLEESDDHAHGAECVCPGGELICGLEEQDPHYHSLECVVSERKQVCGLEEYYIPSDGEVDPEAIKKMLIDDPDIPYDPDTQSILLVDVRATQSDHLKAYDLYDVEKRIALARYPFDLVVNGVGQENGTRYYYVDPVANIITAYEVEGLRDSWDKGVLRTNANDSGILAVILNKGDSYSIAPNVQGWYYSDLAWDDENGNEYNGDGFHFTPVDEVDIKGYQGTATEGVLSTAFSFVWDWMNYLDVETYNPSESEKVLQDLGGSWGESPVDGYINFKIELRDADGNITLLPKRYVNQYGNDGDCFMPMNEDGIIPIRLQPDGTKEGSYGEWDVYIPFGYDYRLIPLDDGDYPGSIGKLGGLAYVYNQEHLNDADGFYITDKVLLRDGSDEWGSWIEYTYMPQTQEIRVEKRVEGSAPANQTYCFQLTEMIPSYVDPTGYGDFTRDEDDLKRLLVNYPYEVYDIETGDKVGDRRTDATGHFEIAGNQYAVFKVWELVDDFDTYDRNGVTFLDMYRVATEKNEVVPTKGKYMISEISTGDFTTSATLISGGAETPIVGSKVDEVVGGDILAFLNAYATTPTPGPGPDDPGSDDPTTDPDPGSDDPDPDPASPDPTPEAEPADPGSKPAPQPEAAGNVPMTADGMDVAMLSTLAMASVLALAGIGACKRSRRRQGKHAAR